MTQKFGDYLISTWSNNKQASLQMSSLYVLNLHALSATSKA